MQDLYEYHIKVEGQIDEKAINAASPIRVAVTKETQAITMLTIGADQSGLIGLLRYLHQQGYVLLSVTRA